MRFISWNVAGLRSITKRGFDSFLYDKQPDVVCLQETRVFPEQFNKSFKGYHMYWNSSNFKGYSGTAVLCKHEPLSVKFDLNFDECVGEGRVITVEYETFYLVNVYTPNAMNGFTKLDYRIVWDTRFRQYIFQLDAMKPVIICGDFNVVHKPNDAYSEVAFKGSPCFSNPERAAFEMLLGLGFVDALRVLYPYDQYIYSCWPSANEARKQNNGIRIDYYLVSHSMRKQISDILYAKGVVGSDHCPVYLEMSGLI